MKTIKKPQMKRLTNACYLIEVYLHICLKFHSNPILKTEMEEGNSLSIVLSLGLFLSYQIEFFF